MLKVVSQMVLENGQTDILKRSLDLPRKDELCGNHKSTNHFNLAALRGEGTGDT